MSGAKAVPFKKDNAAYEAWLANQCDVVVDDLAHKHDRMRENAFAFLRATYFRWAKRIGSVCPELLAAPKALCVGDLHVENFGTWRDIEGRWIWGINDFDEAAEMPYALDLVRLATSMRLAPDRVLTGQEIAERILDGYRKGLKRPGPTLLDERQQWMRPYVACTDKERAKFWDDVDRYPDATPPPPHHVQVGLRRNLPTGAELERFATRVRGGGSLGRPRFVAIAAYGGGRVVREAKALVPSAWTWAHGSKHVPLPFLELARGRHRSPDPYLAVHDGFVFRRIAPDSRKINLDRVDGMKFTSDVPWAMGVDLASIHAAHCSDVATLKDDLSSRPPGWLRQASRTAQDDVENDYATWL
jgi:hypothetical protein